MALNLKSFIHEIKLIYTRATPLQDHSQKLILNKLLSCSFVKFSAIQYKENFHRMGVSMWYVVWMGIPCYITAKDPFHVLVPIPCMLLVGHNISDL